jgi:hypothetical protein
LDLYACTQCKEGYKINLFGGCDSENGNAWNYFKFFLLISARLKIFNIYLLTCF